MKAALAALAVALIAVPCVVLLTLAPPPAQAGGCNVTGAGGPAVGPWTTGLDNGQIQVAQTLAAVVTARKLPAQAIVILEMTARQESGLRNVQHGDAAGPDSLGVLQQRGSWGPAVARLNPAAAAGLFLDRLITVQGWNLMPPQHAAHIVQVNQNEGDYTRWVPWAAAATAALAGGSGVIVTCGAPPATGGGGNNVAGQTTLPAGLTVTGTTRGNKAAAWALLQLGKPYVFGAAGPDSFDCSGLTMAAWATEGVNLPHFTVTQEQAGTAVNSIGQAVSGDLVFIPGSDGTPAAPGHVGMIAGTSPGHTWLIQAPMTGVPVEITDSAQWAGQIVGIRHIA